MAKRVYFAFRYQDVIDFRAKVVRKDNFLGSVESAGYYDHSIWEEAKKTSPLALKRLINAELGNTTITAEPIGSETYARRCFFGESCDNEGVLHRVRLLLAGSTPIQ